MALSRMRIAAVATRHSPAPYAKSRDWRPGLCVWSQRLNASERSVTAMMAMVAPVGTMDVRVSIVPVMAMAMVAMTMVIVAVPISVHRPTGRSHDHRR